MILDEIVARKKQDLELKKQQIPLTTLQNLIKSEYSKNIKSSKRNFINAITRNNENERIKIIAELKKASPISGIIRNEFNPVKLAQQLEEAGAHALSVLTESHFFKGDLAYLGEVKKNTSILPILRKDFIIDRYQLYESYCAGADAVLLIVSVLENSELAEYITIADKELDLACLVEVHNFEELSKALTICDKTNARKVGIGINNRDLKTFQVDFETTLKLIEFIPDKFTVVSESGIKSNKEVAILEKNGVDAILVGETLMRALNPAEKIKELFKEVTY